MASVHTRARSLARRSALAIAPPVRRVVQERAELQRKNERLRAELSTIKGRVATLELAAGTAVKDYDYLFIVSYGRSGSTLLQGILCSAPGVLIRGENRDAFHRLFHYQKMLKSLHTRFADRPPAGVKNPWYGIEEWSEEESLAGLRALAVQTILHPKSDTRVLGFKEIRWWYGDWRPYLDFMQELFPGARFVINSRNVANAAKSSWWANRPDAAEHLREYDSRIPEMMQILGDAAYRVHFDDYIADPGVLAGLYEWMGEPFDRAAIDAVINVRHSF